MMTDERKWFNPVNRMDVEKALDKGMLYVAISDIKFWVARRNGATRTWIRDPKRFYIPVKYGFRGYGAITETTDMTLLRIAGSREDAEHA